MKATLKRENGIYITETNDLKTIRGIRNRFASVLNDMKEKGRFVIEIDNGNETYTQGIQV